MSARQSSETVAIPGVAVKVEIERAGDPLMLILTKRNGAGQAMIHVSATGIDEDALCALLRVVATTIEERNNPPAEPHVHNHPPHRPMCNERRLPDGQLRGACLNDDGSDR